MASLNTPVQPNIWGEIAVFDSKLVFYWQNSLRMMCENVLYPTEKTSFPADSNGR